MDLGKLRVLDPSGLSPLLASLYLENDGIVELDEFRPAVWGRRALSIGYALIGNSSPEVIGSFPILEARFDGPLAFLDLRSRRKIGSFRLRASHYENRSDDMDYWFEHGKLCLPQGVDVRREAIPPCEIYFVVNQPFAGGEPRIFRTDTLLDGDSSYDLKRVFPSSWFINPAFRHVEVQ